MSRTLTSIQVVLELSPAARRHGLVGFSEALLPPGVTLETGDHVTVVNEGGREFPAVIERVEIALIGVRYIARLVS